MWLYGLLLFFFFKQKTAYEMRISDWSSDVCSSDLARVIAHWDKLFKGVTVVDGSGAAAFAGDVAVTEGRIAAAAPTLDGEADEAIEGRGRVLAPGFIDVHTHEIGRAHV